VVVTAGSLVAFVTGSGIGLDEGEGVLAMTTRPPRPTWLHPSPKSICSAVSSARLAFGAGGWLFATFWRPWPGVCFARAALSSFHFTHPRYFAVWLPPQMQH
jgi:hypothetical protein